MANKKEYILQNQKFLCDIAADPQTQALPKGILYQVIKSSFLSNKRPIYNRNRNTNQGTETKKTHHTISKRGILIKIFMLIKSSSNFSINKFLNISIYELSNVF